MHLLLDNPQAARFSDGYAAVVWAIEHSEKKYGKMPSEERRKEKNTGLFVDKSKLDKWREELTKMLSPPAGAGVPVVTGVVSATGSAAGGDAVTITGSGFTGAAGVGFGAATAPAMSVDSGTQITATSPAGAGTVDVTVTSPAGTSATSAAGQFTYL